MRCRRSMPACGNCIPIRFLNSWSSRSLREAATIWTGPLRRRVRPCVAPGVCPAGNRRILCVPPSMMLKNDSMMVCRPFSARMVLTAVRRASGRWLAFLAGSLLVLLCGWSGTAAADDQFLDPAAAFVATAAMPDPQTLDVHYAVAPGYYMYQERFEVRVEDAQKRLLLYRPSTLTPPDL